MIESNLVDVVARSEFIKWISAAIESSLVYFAAKIETDLEKFAATVELVTVESNLLKFATRLRLI